MNSKVLVMYHEKFKQYDLGEGHPLRGDRYVNAMNFFREHGLLNLDDVTVREPPLATIEDLLMVHDKRYVDTIFRLAERGIAYDLETPISPGILEAALLFVGGSIECGKAVMKGDVEKAISIGGGFHHAGKDYGGGFWIFNDIAVAAEWVKVKMNVKRVLILDYDAHFGNGTS
ncbi:MAG: histone deacetylase family protein, partial [Candidatus Bathyarchaeia archaeon]